MERIKNRYINALNQPHTYFDKVISIDQCYSNLAIAIVVQAIKDVANWRLEKMKPPKGRSRKVCREGKKALEFLHDESRLNIYIPTTTEYIDRIINEYTTQLLYQYTERKYLEGEW